MKMKRNKKPGGEWVSANDALKSNPINGVGIPSQFIETCEQLEYLYDGLNFTLVTNDWVRNGS